MMKWWQKAVFYQIYPRSFADGNGDGIGDFAGMSERLDYLQELGIDAVWLSPHYPSPYVDCGYDISNYTDVAPEYGTLDDFKHFLAGAHQRGIKVILDLVLNHTSEEHPWFIESRSSRDNPKRDWYIWRDGRDGGPPNNWLAGFGGLAWEYDAGTEQYYYHYFLKEQPDLNWRNPAVKEAMWDVVRFWLDMGVDGFRLDAVDTIFEHPDMPDHTVEIAHPDLYNDLRAADNEDELARQTKQREEVLKYQRRQPGVHKLMQELRALIDAEYDDRVLVGESDDILYYGDGNNELHLIFNFELLKKMRLNPAIIRANQRERLAALPPGAWPCNTLGNHDAPRVYSRFGDGAHDAEIARLSLALMLTLRGTPFLYNGEEIGMTDLLLDDARQLRDTLAIRAYRASIEKLGISPTQALARAAKLSRDKTRTPMQWANAPNAGFSPARVQTWLPVNPNYTRGVNVAEQLDDASSLLNFYRAMLRVQRENPALIAGDYVTLHEDAADYLAFLRRGETQTCLVILNYSGCTHELRFELEFDAARRLFSNCQRVGESDDLARLKLMPFEVYVAELQKE